MADEYTRQFFINNIDCTVPSVKPIVTSIMENYEPQSVIDFGCATGIFLREFKAQGVTDILGLDLYPPDDLLQIPKENFMRFDVTKPLFPNRRFDVAICLEVAEHIPRESSMQLVTSLSMLSDNIIFSGAHVGQGGHGHINERPVTDWIDMFNAVGFYETLSTRADIKNNPQVAPWYRENIVDFRKF